MRIKLFYKLFGAFFLIASGIIVLWIGAFYYTITNNFRDYVNKMELEIQYEVIDELKNIYTKTNSWEAIHNNQSLWIDILSKMFARRLSSPPPPPPLAPIEIPPEMDQIRKEFMNLEEKTRQNINKRAINPRVYKRAIRPRVYMRVVLLDENRKEIAGILDDPKDFNLKPIELNDKIIGWLGLRKDRKLSNPIDIRFLQQQTQLIFIIGGCVLILALVFSFLLSRHLLSPIERLTKGTKAIANRKFDSRIKVNTTDELGELAEDFNAMAKTLEHYEELRKQWITDISHELGTPLSILQGEIEAIQDGIRKPDEISLASLHSEVLHLSTIVNDLRELSLAETGGLTFKMESLNLADIIDNTVAVYKMRFDRKQIKIIKEPGSEMNITGDYIRLQQVLSNIMENALRYSDSPGSLKIGHFSKEKKAVLFIEDSGPGVPEASLPHLFDRLYRVEKSRNRAKGGTGLGLAICKHIVEAHQGSISARNIPGNGLRIEIELLKI
ncbi:HAMP domain-containing protein [bacterium]|nr:HAMP domain-containing protein [bacterium]